MPKIWVDLAARLLGEDMLETAGDPGKALESTARAAAKLGLDGARLFHLPARRFSRTLDGAVVEIDERGRRVGFVDTAGGLATKLDDPGAFDIENPADIAYAQFRTSSEPFVRDEADAKRMAIPDRGFWEGCGAAERTRRAIGRYGGEVALIGDLGSATLSFCATLRGMERTLFDIVDSPGLVHALMDSGARIAIEKAKFNVDLGLKVLRLNDSAGTMSLISRATWREFIFPRIRDIVVAVKAHDPRARIYCHICGNILPIAEDLVEAGVDCLGPLDPLGGSTPGRLRAIIGDRAALMGGIDTLSFLNGTPESISREALDCMISGGPRGGFVLGSGCVVPRDSPAANILAARDAAVRWGTYSGSVLSASRRSE